MKYSGTVAALCTTRQQVVRCLAEARRRCKRITLILAVDEREPDVESIIRSCKLPRTAVSVCHFGDFIDEVEAHECVTVLARECLRRTREILSMVQQRTGLEHDGVPLADLVQQLFHANHAWPLYQRLYEADRILGNVKPDEVWVCAGANWKHTILEPRWVNLTRWCEYRGTEVEAFRRAAGSRAIPIRHLKVSLSDRARYVFTRFTRPQLVRIYRQLQLTKAQLARLRNRNIWRGKRSRRPMVLALVRSPVHAARLLPVLDALSKSWDTCILDDLSLAVRHPQRSTAPSVTTISLAHWQGPVLYRDTTYSRTLRRWLKREGVPRCSVRGIPIDDALSEILRQLADKYVEAACLLDALDRIISRVRPSVVLLANDQDLPARCLVTLCAQRGIRTIVVQHGLMAAPPLHFVPLAADHIAVMGTMAADLLVDFGTPPERIHVTGIPGFDAYREGTAPATAANSGWITLITQKLPAFFDLVFPRFLNLARAMPHETFKVKVAPQESPSKYANSLPNVELCEGQSLEDVLRGSKLVIGFNSTALLEAMQIQIPAMIVEMRFEHLNPLSLGAVTVGLDADWVEVVSKIAANESIRVEIVERQNRSLAYILRDEAGAAARIAELVCSIEAERASGD